MSEKFKNKKILFIAPLFFDYEQEIIKKLGAMGATVDFYDERPANDFTSRVFIKFYKKGFEKKIEKYYQNLLTKTNEIQYDIVFVVNIDAMTISVLEKLKYQQKNAQFILYMWDSLRRKRNIINILPLFDRVYSFDKEDVESYNCEFRPLFFLDEYAQPFEDNITDIDLCFIGSIHGDRYSFLKKIQTQVENSGYNCYFFMFFYSPVLFWIKKIYSVNFRKAKIKEFQFKPLAPNEVINVIHKSKVILDIQHVHQTGLTMRTIEMLGAHKKIITTNQHIKEYDFYNENNIYAIDRDQPMIDPDFFSSPYQQIDDAVYQKYSLESWLIDILV